MLSFTMIILVLAQLVIPEYSSPMPYNDAFMYGDIYARVIFVESSGDLNDGADWKEQQSIEDWTLDQQLNAKEQIQKAFDWWKVMTPKAHTKFSATYETYNTKQEPVSDMSDLTWMNEIGSKIYPAYSEEWFSDKLIYGAESDRVTRLADNSFIIFVVNNKKTQRLFTGDMLGKYFVGIPVIILVTDGYTYADGLAASTAHEIGHIFGALDEYRLSDPNCTDKGGYLQIENQNAEGCLYNEPSIMKYPRIPFATFQTSAITLAQVGYRDDNCNGVIDPLDNDKINHCFYYYLPLIP